MGQGAEPSRLNWSLAPEGGPDDEAEAVYGRADHQGFAGAGAGYEDSRATFKVVVDTRGSLPIHKDATADCRRDAREIPRYRKWASRGRAR